LILSSTLPLQPAVGANLLCFLIFAPEKKNQTGIGRRIAAKHPTSVIPQLIPRRLNIYVEKRGQAAAMKERIIVFAATADAALRLKSVGRRGGKRIDLQDKVTIDEIIQH
jgi:hypothetical protein